MDVSLIHNEPQKLTSFPNDNSKHIDYVIVYGEVMNQDESIENSKARYYREAFFELLKREGLEMHYLEENRSKQKRVYALIHCPLEKLLIEAESINLRMPLKDVHIKTPYKQYQKSF